MLAPTPTPDYVSFRATQRDSSVSPYRGLPQTPPRPTSHLLAHGSPVFTPSPLRRSDLPSADLMDMDDVFQSPADPLPSTSHLRWDQLGSGPHISWDDGDGEEPFLVPSSSKHHLAPPTSPLFARTPLRTSHTSTPAAGMPDRPVLTNKHLSTLHSSRTARNARTKGRPPPRLFTPAANNRVLTPLSAVSVSVEDQEDSPVVSFDRLAPLPPPQFHPRTPSPVIEADAHLTRQAGTMTLLKMPSMCGLDTSFDSGAEDDEEDQRDRQRLLLGEGPKADPISTAAKGKHRVTPAKSPALELFIRNGQATEEEVAEAHSPGGHVTKRRARARPVSSELLQHMQDTPALLRNKVQAAILDSPIRSVRPVNLPYSRLRSGLRSRPLRRSESSSTISSVESPIPPLRLTHAALARINTESEFDEKTPLSRVTSASSISLFFGPSIPQPHLIAPAKPGVAPNLAASPSSAGDAVAFREAINSASTAGHRDGSSSDTAAPRRVQDDDPDSSLESSPRSRKRTDSFDEELYNDCLDTSFIRNLAKDLPSPKKKQKRVSPSPLPKKFRPRDSGIAFELSDDEGRALGGDLFMPIMPRASTSVSTVNSGDDDRALVTPSFAPSAASGWPTAQADVMDQDESTDEMNEFILRTLAANAGKHVPGDDEPKKAPGTPVKVKMVQRPWQTAMATKIGFREFDGSAQRGGKKAKGKPRKSLPAAFAGFGKENRSFWKKSGVAVDAEADAVEGDDMSPSMRKASRYEGLGLGRPSGMLWRNPEKEDKQSWLVRRSSSGNCSSGSETASSIAETPTRSNGNDWQLPPVRPLLQDSPLKKSVNFSANQAASGSGASTKTNSRPSSRLRRPSIPSRAQPTPIRPALITRPKTHGHPSRLGHGKSSPPRRTGLRARFSLASSDERPGRFEREFVEVDELGTGEFGKVMKVRYKDGIPIARGKEGECYAIKKSKRFEGAKHRLRLREEVDVLAHLTRAGGHPNVLAYIDSWEEDETLFIRTELCANGNFAHFLVTYGRKYPRLDEGRVWRILAELSAGLNYIHKHGVLHLDLKPDNIFISQSGRLKIGDFGMASLWPRPPPPPGFSAKAIFEREGDKLYLAPEVLQGRYSTAVDVFSLGMTILETATNVVIPDQGEGWHRLRQEDFSQVDSNLTSLSGELRKLIKSMMRTDPDLRIGADVVASHPVVSRARAAMESVRASQGDVFAASPLYSDGRVFLHDIMRSREWDHDSDMDAGY
ncbi:hypothetical protein WOLCODRAFT_138608 [Wolfiporia cocos MD-104 SS10]|uniref:Protein kinase domain-containing protein n=1 Tax=Wolfiporia cocos (strain MD-104) TaxID=742152 RepID=A0A2H3JQM5_WOLCO|nr:hypothetical protein WOLCODRAFT_138608 [Wolfiporia cocos MD-104 SS10]